MLVKVLILLCFFLVTLGVGLACRRSTSDVHGFVLGSRAVGSWLTAFAYGTSYFSAVIFVGYAGQFGWKYGVAATWIGLGNAFFGSLLAWHVLGRRTRIMTQQLDSATMPEFFGKRFLSPALRIPAAAIVFVFLGSMFQNDLVWELTDMFNNLMVIPNVIALFALGGLVVSMTKFSKKSDMPEIKDKK